MVLGDHESQLSSHAVVPRVVDATYRSLSKSCFRPPPAALVGGTAEYIEAGACGRCGGRVAR
eukprot:m.295235 g.295235  ORF g.295235 m.295235 type:complete len:62 (+) comp27174_c2_seq7:76-261(+)